jgi:hypothetical protein
MVNNSWPWFIKVLCAVKEQDFEEMPAPHVNDPPGLLLDKGCDSVKIFLVRLRLRLLVT